MVEDFLASTYRRPDFVLERGQGVWLYDSQGREYLDMASGIAVNALGYEHPEIQQVLQQPGLIHVSNLYHTGPAQELARALCRGSFADRVFFCNSGTEANEGALKFARKLGGAGRRHLVAFSEGFHGRTMGALSLTANPRYREPFEPLIGGVRFATFNCLDSLEQVLDESVAAVLVEPIQGEGGVRPASEEFLRGLREACDRVGALLIFDEVQCGMGRTGKLWAYQHSGVVPDMLTVAKPLGGGLPIGAILLSGRVAAAVEPGDHGSTFGGGPLVTRLAARILEIVQAPDFLAQVEARGQDLQRRLERLQSETGLGLKVQGRGLMWGWVLPDSLPVSRLVEAGYRHGLIMLSSGGNTLRLLPPLILEASHLTLFEERMRACLKELACEVA